MERILSIYNRNRKQIWTFIIGLIFVIVIIQILNSFSEEKRKTENEENKKNMETTSNVVSYNNESQSIISGGAVSSKYSNKMATIIDQFFTYCVEHNPNAAYELLSDEMKSSKYKTEGLFEELYYKGKFEGDKEYSFQSWSTAKSNYIYVVKIYDNMLATGKNTTTEYVEDYITLVPQEDTYKINVDKFVGQKDISKEANNELINVKAAVSNIYMDYEIYTFRIKNNTDEEILIDTRKNSNTLYLEDENKVTYKSLLYENSEEELKLKPQESKTITIKFNVAYRSDLKIKTVNFTNIVKSSEYQKNPESIGTSLKIEV